MVVSEKIYKALNEKNAIQRYLARKIFTYLENIGWHLLGDHFYEPIPNTKYILEQYKDEPRSNLNIDFRFNESENLTLNILDEWGKSFYAVSTQYGYEEKNYYFSGLDSIILYCFLRQNKPKQVIEVGQGVSTRVIIAALEQNFKDSGEIANFISIDPYARFSNEEKETQVKCKIIREPLQRVPTSLFTELGESDFLFIDSSHVYKFGSDVEYQFENIYPNLNKGVYIHIHDIFSPYHYPLDWYIKQKRFWNEQYYLETMLRLNKLFKVIIPVNYLSRCSESLKVKSNLICNYENFKCKGSSFYIQKII